ncbi:MAG: NAD(P)H-quinone oxidoreductase subunit I [Anaerolineae bacterium]|nr:NAD(P)H-quinone oxidoreductase subunit I [Gloeobacterales cyanobacterium ES-bin-313]
MVKFLDKIGGYAKDVFDSAKYIGQGMGLVFDHMRRKPVTVQYPYEKLIPSERFRGRIHFERPKCISCEVCVRVCPINLPVVDYDFNKETKKKELNSYSIDFGVCIFCGNCVEYCPTSCLSMTEEYEMSVYDRHELNYDDVALGRLPTKVTDDPAVRPLRELAYLPKGVMDGHDVDPGARRAGELPEEIVARSKPTEPNE